MDAVRREAEEADAIQGFSLVHALGGGAGSGLGTLLLERLCDEYADRMIASFPVFPAAAASDAVLETFNAAMCVPRLVDRCDVVLLADNGALRRACDRDANRRHERTTLLRLAVPPPEASMDDLNRALATAMAGATATLRFPGRLNASLRKLAVNLSPFPRLHFASPSHAPLLAVDEYVPGTVRHLVKEAFAPYSRRRAASRSPPPPCFAASTWRRRTPSERFDGDETRPGEASRGSRITCGARCATRRRPRPWARTRRVRC